MCELLIKGLPDNYFPKGEGKAVFFYTEEIPEEIPVNINMKNNYGFTALVCQQVDF